MPSDLVITRFGDAAYPASWSRLFYWGILLAESVDLEKVAPGDRVSVRRRTDGKETVVRLHESAHSRCETYDPGLGLCRHWSVIWDE